MMQFLSVTCLLVLLSFSAVGETPKEFLQTKSPGWNKILETRVSIDAEGVNATDAIHFISQQTDANVEINLGETDKNQGMTGSLSFTHVAFRDVLYAIQEKWNLQMSWKMNSSQFPTQILVTTKK